MNELDSALDAALREAIRNRDSALKARTEASVTYQRAMVALAGARVELDATEAAVQSAEESLAMLWADYRAAMESRS